MRHRCPERKKLDELRSPLGQQAYLLYSEWMRRSKRSVPPIETFADSTLYTTFVKFASYAERTNLPNVPLFIRLMAEHGVSPPLWARDQTFALYLQFVDEATPPVTQFIESLDKLEEVARDYECSLPRVWATMPHELLVQLIKRRKLSPWFVLSCHTYREHAKALPEPLARELRAATCEGAMLELIQHNQALFAEFNRATREKGL